MIDWVDGIETRNYGIKSNLNAGMLSELMRVIISFVMFAGVLLFFTWVRSQIVNTGYENQQLRAEEESLLRIQKKLIIEEETLKSLDRIDTIARNELNMIALQPKQIILTQLNTTRQSTPNVLAMADSGAAHLGKNNQTGVVEIDRNN